MTSPVRLPAGVSTAAKNSTLFNLPAQDPTKIHAYFNDFDTFVAGDWTITTTEGGAGSATEALTDADGGVLLITNDDADNDLDFFQKVGESFLLEAGKKAWFKTRLKLSKATESEFYAGLMITDTDPLSSTAGDGVTDGVFFLKEDGSTDIKLYAQKDATTGQAVTSAVGTLAADTYITLGWEWDGVSSIKAYVDDVHKATITGVYAAGASVYLPDTELTVSFGLKNGEAGAQTMSLDYIYAAKER